MMSPLNRRHADLLQGLGHRPARRLQSRLAAQRRRFRRPDVLPGLAGLPLHRPRSPRPRRSSQPWQGNDLDTYADDLAELVAALDLKEAIHVGHSTGGGEVTRYIGRHGTGARRQGGADRRHPAADAENRRPIPAACRSRSSTSSARGVQADRSQFWKDLSLPFYGYNRPGAKISEGVRESFWLQGMMAGFPASYFCIKAFSETDLTEDLKRFDVPTLILHGDDDQIVPIGASALLSSKIVKDAKLVVYKGAPHGMCTTLKDRVNDEFPGLFWPSDRAGGPTSRALAARP